MAIMIKTPKTSSKTNDKFYKAFNEKRLQ